MRSTLKHQLLARTGQLAAAREALWSLRDLAAAALDARSVVVDAAHVLGANRAHRQRQDGAHLPDDGIRSRILRRYPRPLGEVGGARIDIERY
jgi:hypothetical protein